MCYFNNWFRSCKIYEKCYNKKYFSLQTQKQIDIGLEIVKMASEDSNQTESTMKPIISLIKQMLSRDEGWKEYYNDEMQSIEEEENESSIYDQLLEESIIEKMYSVEEYEKASSAMQKFIGKYVVDPLEKDGICSNLLVIIIRLGRRNLLKFKKQRFNQILNY